MAYKIIDWIRAQPELSAPYTNYRTVSEQAEKLVRNKMIEDAKRHRRLESYIRGGGLLSDTSDKSGFNFTAEITRTNLEWMNELIDQVNQAETQDGLGEVEDRIVTDRAADKSNFEDEFEKRVRQAIKTRRGEIRPTFTFGPIRSKIESATTLDQIDAINIPNLNLVSPDQEAEREDIIDLFNDRRFEIQEETGFFDQTDEEGDE